MKVFGYAAAHFAVDLCCALLLFRQSGHAQWVLALLLYNFCAFALQLPLGIAADKLNRNHTVAAAGMLLIAVSFLLSGFLFPALLAGCGNALFHVGGGIEALNQSHHRAFRLGLFVAPGALGLYLGTQWGKGGPLLWLPPLLLAAAGMLLLRFGYGKTQNAAPLLPSFRMVLWCQAAVVVLRSYIGFCLLFSWNTSFWSGLAVAAATVLGKAAGGFLLDRWGYTPTVGLSLLSAAACFLFPQFPVFGLMGILFFQMTMPVTLWTAARCCPQAKGFSFGLLTFGLFLGFLPKLLGWPMPQNGILWAAGALLSLLLMLPARRSAR